MCYVKFENIDILIDNPDSWMWKYIASIQEVCNRYSRVVRVFKNASEIRYGDIMFILGCDKILNKKLLQMHTSNVVVHESDLPYGKGWSPLSWQVESGLNEIPITMFEASNDLDAGDWYIKDVITLDGFELIDELRYKQADKTMKMIDLYLEQFPVFPNKQIGIETKFQKRKEENQEINIEKTIKEQFNKLRVCDNDRYPAHFFMVDKNGNRQKYIIKIYKD